MVSWLGGLGGLQEKESKYLTTPVQKNILDNTFVACVWTIFDTVPNLYLNFFVVDAIAFHSGYPCG